MRIREASSAEIPELMDIFVHAREYMRANGNGTQWPDDYPSLEIVESEIANSQRFVFDDDGDILGTFSLIAGEDSTYGVIEQGDWSQDAPYSTIHRLASWGKVHGLSRACFDFCTQHADYLRIDTHACNASMLAAIRSYGFRECGIIHIWDGTPRIAFDYIVR